MPTNVAGSALGLVVAGGVALVSFSTCFVHGAKTDHAPDALSAFALPTVNVQYRVYTIL